MREIRPAPQGDSEISRCAVRQQDYNAVFDPRLSNIMSPASSPDVSGQLSVVLLLQDDSLELYEWYLKANGFTIVATDDPAAALNAAPGADLIVTGIKLRGPFDGIELIRRLRDDDRTRNKPVVVLSASVTATSRQRAFDAGCDLFLPKPCLPDELVARLRELLVGSKAQRLESVSFRARAASLIHRARELLESNRKRG